MLVGVPVVAGLSNHWIISVQECEGERSVELPPGNGGLGGVVRCNAAVRNRLRVPLRQLESSAH